MRYSLTALVALTTLASDPASAAKPANSKPEFEHRLYEGLPPNIEATKVKHDNELRMVARSISAREFDFVVAQAHRWQQDKPLRVAFLGSDPTAYGRIETAVADWTRPGYANIHFQFKDAAGHYLKWTRADKKYVAEIRIAFQSDKVNGGYWSMIGTDSTDPTLPGGAPGQVSMNLQGIDGAASSLPSDWRGTVLHEFGHALGFEHEHQSPAANCDFRFNDDKGYVPTTKDRWWSNDSAGRRPGLYRFLGGYSNYWPPKKIDQNLKAMPASSAFVVGPFDRASIMMYYFDASFFDKGAQSSCYTGAENEVLSPTDKIGVARIYPAAPAAVNAAILAQLQTLNRLRASNLATTSLKATLDQRLKALTRKSQD